MIYGCSTFKSSELTNRTNENACAVISDLSSQTSTFGIPKISDNCEAYYNLLDGLKKIHAKVDSGDLSDFTE